MGSDAAPCLHRTSTRSPGIRVFRPGTPRVRGSISFASASFSVCALSEPSSTFKLLVVRVAPVRASGGGCTGGGGGGCSCGGCTVGVSSSSLDEFRSIDETGCGRMRWRRV